MLNKDKDYLSISLSEDSIRLLHLKAVGGQPKVMNVGKRDLKGVPPEEWARAIQSVLTDFNIKKPSAVCAVPTSVVTTKNIEIPSLDPTEIKSIIDLQAGRHTPFAREEILIGHITIGIFQRNYTKVLLIIVNREVIKKQLGILEEAGIKVEKVLFAPETMAKFYAQALNIKEEDPPVGILNVTQQYTDFLVSFNKTIAMCRNVPIGMSHLIKDPASREKLVEELNKSIEAYVNEDINKVPETYYLTSDDAKLKELQPLLQERLKANVRILPYLDKVQGTQPVMLKFVSEYNDDSFLDTVACAVASEQVQVDLTPDEIKMQRTIEEKGRQMIRTLTFSFMILVLLFAIFSCKIYFKNILLSKLVTDYVEKQMSVIYLDRIGHKTRIIKDYLRDRMISLDVIDALYKLVPDEVYLENISMEDDGTIAIQGVSDSMSVIFKFVTALEESPLFKSVKTQSTTAKRERDKDVAAFEIAFRLESAKDLPAEDKAGGKDGKEEKDAKEKAPVAEKESKK